MLRLIYGEMMGQDVQFGAIYALKLAQSGQTVAEKRAGIQMRNKNKTRSRGVADPFDLLLLTHYSILGYLACYLLLQEGNELNIMLINTLQKVCYPRSKVHQA